MHENSLYNVQTFHLTGSYMVLFSWPPQPGPPNADPQTKTIVMILADSKFLVVLNLTKYNLGIYFHAKPKRQPHLPRMLLTPSKGLHIFILRRRARPPVKVNRLMTMMYLFQKQKYRITTKCRAALVPNTWAAPDELASPDPRDVVSIDIKFLIFSLI